MIESIELSNDRIEVDTETTLTATVKDAETPVEELKYEWKADVGTFTGEGASVKWRAPKDVNTPFDVAATLTVTETYGTADANGVRPQHVVSSISPKIRVHDSPKELGDMSMAFLLDFANSSISSSVCLRDFSDSCNGKREEKVDIDWNRDHFTILSSSLRLRTVKVGPSGQTADVNVACSFTSRTTKCEPDDRSCVVGHVGTVSGDCLLSGIYEQKRWWLCDSHFNGQATPALKTFFGIR